MRSSGRAHRKRVTLSWRFCNIDDWYLVTMQIERMGLKLFKAETDRTLIIHFERRSEILF